MDVVAIFHRLLSSLLHCWCVVLLAGTSNSYSSSQEERFGGTMDLLELDTFQYEVEITPVPVTGEHLTSQTGEDQVRTLVCGTVLLMGKGKGGRGEGGVVISDTCGWVGGEGGTEGVDSCHCVLVLPVVCSDNVSERSEVPVSSTGYGH